MTTTVSLIDQLRASRAIYANALENIDGLSDNDLCRMLAGAASASTLDRVLALASDSTVDRVLALASASTVARVIDLASASTLDRVLALASDSTVARVLALASDSTVDRVLALASASTMARLKTLKDLEIPIVEDLDKRVAEAADAGKLDMNRWHCGTTHCRAGWAVVFGGEAGMKLEQALGSELAGRLIYEASTGRPAPDFYASQDSALEDIRRCAALPS